MSKHYFHCPVCKVDVPTDDVVLSVDGKLTGEIRHKCGAKVEAIESAWEVEPMSEKARAFVWASCVMLITLSVWVLVQRHMDAPALPPFTLDALKHWRLPW